MPRLLEDGTIEFSSADEFISEYDENLSRNGLFVQTNVDLPMRIRRTFTLVLKETSTAITMVAEPVFFADGMMGLEVAMDPTTHGELKGLATNLKEAKKGGGAEPAAPAPEPAASASEPAAAPATASEGGEYWNNEKPTPAPQAVPSATTRVATAAVPRRHRRAGEPRTARPPSVSLLEASQCSRLARQA